MGRPPVAPMAVPFAVRKMAEKVLIAQLNPQQLQALADYFQSRGDLVWTASSLKDVGKVVQRYHPDLILLDVGFFGDNWQKAVPDFQAGANGARVMFTGNGHRRWPLGKHSQFTELGVLRPPFNERKMEKALSASSNGSTPHPSEAEVRPAPARIRFPIRSKITLPYVGLAIFLAVVAAYVVTNVVLDTIEERFKNSLIETGRLAAEWTVKEEDRLLESLRLVAYSTGMAEATAAGDAEQLRAIVLPLALNSGIEAVEILDLNAMSLLSLRHPEDSALEEYAASRGETIFRDWTFVQIVLARQVDEIGDKYAGVVQAPWGEFLYVSGPVLDEAGKLVGVVLIGERLSTMTSELRQATLAQTTVYTFDGIPLATTFLEAADPLAAEYVTGILAQQDNQSYLRNLRSTNIDYSEILTSLEARGGLDVAIIGSSLPQTFLVEPSQITRAQIFGLATLSILLVIGAGLLVANRITKPLLQVVQASSEVAKGNLTVKLETRGNDELATLGSAFNEMVSSLDRSNRELMDAYNSTLEGWSKALELRDEDTEGHTQRVTDMTVFLARRMGFTSDDLVQIKRGALLHDIGKMGVPDAILNKPGPLTEEEWEVMRKHPIYAYQMLAPIEYLKPALAIPCCHHERWDGTGYPLGWKGYDIPLPARIFAVVDVWDALRSDRPYRGAWEEERVLEYLKDNKGTHFDPEVVDEFLKMLASGGYQDPVVMHTPAMHMATLRRMVPLG
jgi:HD-GYP domain-containing protein (c-di-GMP phosphodiesterase class II)